eukprot:symbB.v1.2.014859.t2/scaffold1095.1/size138309/7
MAAEKKGHAMMVEDDQELDNAVPYRIVCEDSLPHASRSLWRVVPALQSAWPTQPVQPRSIPERTKLLRNKLAGVAGVQSWPWLRRTVSNLKAVPGVNELLTFWFGPEILNARQRLNDIDYLRGRQKMWYMSGTKHDETAKTFLPLLQKYDPKASTAVELESDEVNLAKIVLFDQIPRNAFRGTADAFAYDEAACVVSDAFLRGSFASSCCAAELLCAVQPLVHAEGPGDSRTQLGMRILRENMQRFPDEVSKMIFQAILSHDAHGAVLRRFGRYPHRNLLLGRESTAEEWAPDGSLHSKSFAHTDKGMYFMGMTLMNYKAAPPNQPWIELRR